MAVSFEEVAQMAHALPDVTEGSRHGYRTWFVGKKAFAWERPLSKADLKRLGDSPPPAGPILAVAVADLMEKQAVLAMHSEAFFDIAHFRGFAAVLVELQQVSKPVLLDALVDGWLSCAPSALADEYAATHGLR